MEKVACLTCNQSVRNPPKASVVSFSKKLNPYCLVLVEIRTDLSEISQSNSKKSRALMYIYVYVK